MQLSAAAKSLSDRLITHRTGLADAVRNIPIWATQKIGLIKALIEID